MINILTKSKLRQILDNCGYLTGVDEEGDFYSIMHADKNFGYDVIVYFVLNDSGCLKIEGFAIDYAIEEDNVAKAVMICNTYNYAHFVPNVYVNQRSRVIARFVWFIDEPVSEEYLTKGIRATVGSVWNFFCEFNTEYLK